MFRFGNWGVGLDKFSERERVRGWSPPLGIMITLNLEGSFFHISQLNENLENKL